MGRFYFMLFLLVSTLLFLSISPGFSRKLVKSSSYSLPDSLMQDNEIIPMSPTKARLLMVQLMDYEDDGNAHANDAHAKVIPKVEYPYTPNNPAPSPDNKD